MAGVGKTLRVVALLCLLALLGCTPARGGPVSSPPPTAASQTPTESAQERQERLDYAAAEKAYRTFRAEYNRVLRAGGAKEPTKVMKATAGGPYLAELTEISQAYAGLGLHSDGVERIGYVRRVGYSSKEISLEVCEDSSRVRDVDRAGKVRGKGEVRTTSIEIKRTASGWKVWSGNGKKVSTCT
jgi:hypothetical protein